MFSKCIFDLFLFIFLINILKNNYTNIYNNLK